MVRLGDRVDGFRASGRAAQANTAVRARRAQLRRPPRLVEQREEAAAAVQLLGPSQVD
jgi:hypothetical protein